MSVCIGASLVDCFLVTIILDGDGINTADTPFQGSGDRIGCFHRRLMTANDRFDRQTQADTSSVQLKWGFQPICFFPSEDYLYLVADQLGDVKHKEVS